MSTRKIAVILASIVAVPTTAHHSISRHYHRDQRITLEGSVIDIALINPHAEMRLQVPAGSAGTEIWQLELDDPGDLADQGIVAGTLQRGDALVVNGNPARDGSTRLFVQRFLRPADGLQYEDD